MFTIDWDDGVASQTHRRIPGLRCANSYDQGGKPDKNLKSPGRFLKISDEYFLRGEMLIAVGRYWLLVRGRITSLYTTWRHNL
jgi:hypothetical protein